MGCGIGVGTGVQGIFRGSLSFFRTWICLLSCWVFVKFRGISTGLGVCRDPGA